MPLVVDFHPHGGGRAEERVVVGEEAGHAGAAFEFAVEPFLPVVGAQLAAVFGGEVEDGQPLGHVSLQPSGAMLVEGVLRNGWRVGEFGLISATESGIKVDSTAGVFLGSGRGDCGLSFADYLSEDRDRGAR